MADGIKDIGGFLDAKGNLIQEPLAQKNKPKETTSNNEDSAKVQLDGGKSLDSAISSVSRRTREGVDRAIEANDSAQADVDRAKEIVKEQRKVLNKLEKEVDAKKVDKEKVKELKEKFSDLEQERNAIADQVSKNNQKRLEEGPQAIRVGNKQIASFRPEKVEFSKSKADLDSPEGIKAAKQELKETTKSLKVQSKELKSDRQDIAEASSEARAEIQDVSKKAGSGEANPIRSIDEATQIANRTSSLIKELGQSSVSAATKNLSPETVSRLLQF